MKSETKNGEKIWAVLLFAQTQSRCFDAVVVAVTVAVAVVVAVAIAIVVVVVVVAVRFPCHGTYL